jgi:Flp pilus assembly protein TadD
MAAVGLLPAIGCHNLLAPNTPPTPPTPPPAKPAPKPPAGTAAKKEQELPIDKTADLCVALAEQLEKQGHEAEAAAQYERARQCKPSLNISRRLAVIYDRQGDYQRAIVEYEKALKHEPKNADILNDLGYCHYTHGRWADAEKCLTQAITLDSKNKRAWINLGLALGQEERYKESLEAFTKGSSVAEAHCNLAFILLTQNKFDEAKREYQKALELQPDFALAQAAVDRLNNPHPADEAKANAGPRGAGASPRAQTTANRPERPADDDPSLSTASSRPQPMPLPDLSPVIVPSLKELKSEPAVE